jgi:hypothetical protein
MNKPLTAAAPETADSVSIPPLNSTPDISARLHRDRFDSDEFFGFQPALTSSLPDPDPLLRNLALRVTEISAGARDIDQIARWVTEDVYRRLLHRCGLHLRADSATRRTMARPVIRVKSVITQQVRDGVLEAVVVIETSARTRTVAIRLEGMDRRWRATSIGLL